MNMSELYPKFNIFEENEEIKIILTIVHSLHKIICDEVFEYRRLLSILTLVNTSTLRINTQNFPYGL